MMEHPVPAFSAEASHPYPRRLLGIAGALFHLLLLAVVVAVVCNVIKAGASRRA